MRRFPSVLSAVLVFCGAAILAFAATIVPTDIQQPGTQPGEVGSLESPDKCDNCHGGYNTGVEPAFGWRGGMMANAGRDPIFWATMAIAEQDFEGVGDLCIRCHSPTGWYGGRSTPTDGSGLTGPDDGEGVTCDTCHKMTNPDNSEHVGAMNTPFAANDEQEPATGYYGSGMLSLWGGNEKLGPYADADARHQFSQSAFHRSTDYCGSCHDVSNAVVGDLAHNHGVPDTGDTPIASGVPNGPVDAKAAFNNFPFQYGVVERTFSEYKAGLLSQTRVSEFNTLPDALKAGAVQAVYDAAKGDYADGSPRYFSCQSCHMRPVSGQGCNKRGVTVRSDLPLHDQTGGNYWMPDVMIYLDGIGRLRLGGGLSSLQVAALDAGAARAREQLELAATLSVAGNTLRINNHTGHKLISGYPEGRRMWINIQWFDNAGNLLREDGEYGDLVVDIDGTPTTVQTLLDLHPASTRIYQAHYGMTREWAQQLLGLGYSPDLPLAFDRVSGEVAYTLSELAAQSAGTDHETFHFVLNNTVISDNRIPPYGMSYDAARTRNTLPVPDTQYGNPGAGGTYRYFDEWEMAPPVGATYGAIRLLYQPTSWEYIQFLYEANERNNAFLGDEGEFLLDAWLNTDMAAPHTMATASWGVAPAPQVPPCEAPGTPAELTAKGGKRSITLNWNPSEPTPTGGYRIYYDQSGKLQFHGVVASTTTSYKESQLQGRTQYCYAVKAWNDCDDNSVFTSTIDMESDTSVVACATTR